MTELSTAGGTVSSDYASAYYHGQLGPPYEYDEPHWQTFFGGIADRLVDLFGIGTSYDAGCAKGFLVRELAARGVDARGGDISAFAVENAPPGLAERLEVKDLTEPFADRYDLITCIEVLEHMDAADARTAIGHMCRATDRVLLSSTPDDFNEATHINVRTSASWAQEFAGHGFYRCTDIDASFVSPWAIVFERASVTTSQLVSRYEQLVAASLREVFAKRQALLVARRELDAGIAPVQMERDAAVADRDAVVATKMQLVDENLGLKAQVFELRVHSEYAVAEAGREAERLRQVVAGLEAELRRTIDERATAASESAETYASKLADYESRLADSERVAQELRTSWSWRIGTAVVRPVGWVRKRRRRS